MPLSHVYDTYAKARSGRTMHFDVFLGEQNQSMALHYAKQWLASVGYPDAVIIPENCAFCHSVITPTDVNEQIEAKGYAIYRLDGCPI